MLAIGGGEPLQSSKGSGYRSGEQDQKQEKKTSPLKLSACLAASFTVCGFGAWLILFGAPRRGFAWGVTGAIFMALGWVAVVWHMILLFAEIASASPGFYRVSAPPYGRAEDVRVVPIVVTPLELRNVQREIFSANFVETAHNPALRQRPEAIDSCRMECTVDVLPSGMIDAAVVENSVQRIVSGVFVRRNQAGLFGYGFPNEGVERCGVGVRDEF